MSRGLVATEAVYEHTFSMLTADEGSDLVRSGKREMYRGLYRRLARYYHTDRPGGNIEIFELVQRAWAVGDYGYLTHLWNVHHEANSLWWRAYRGIEYVETVNQTASVRFELLRNTDEFQIVFNLMRGAREAALKQTAIVLTRLIASLTEEIRVARQVAKTSL